MNQTILPLSFTCHYTKDYFIENSCHKKVLTYITYWTTQNICHVPPFLLIYGGKGCGKTHLLKIISEIYKAPYYHSACIEGMPHDLFGSASNPFIIIDDGEALPQNWLFHCYNYLTERGIKWIMSAPYSPEHWPTTLPDWTSRLRTFMAISIEEAEFDTLVQIGHKIFTDYGIDIKISTLEYLITRIDRSYHDMIQWCHYLYQIARERKRQITISFIAEMIKSEN